MIAISGVLVLVAIGLLVTGLVLPNLWLVYASIVASLASAVCLVVGVFIGRGQGPTPSKTSGKGARTKAAKGPPGGSAKKKTTGKRPSGRGRAGAKKPATKESEVDEAVVLVVPGRLRYHLDSCRQAQGKDAEELSVAEARADGYVACTACRPDSVLAARAEQPSADEPADEPASTVETVTMVTGQRRYHLPTCQVVQDAEDDDAETRTLSVADAQVENLTACRVCGAPTEAPDRADDTAARDTSSTADA